MRIHPNLQAARTPAAAGPAAAGGQPGRARFALEETRGPARAATTRSAAPLDTMAAIIALQEDGEEPGERRRRRAGRGNDLLAALDRLKAALLAGQVAPGDLRRLKGLLREGAGPTGDPDLDAIMAAIELRAEVELAKLAMAGVSV